MTFNPFIKLTAYSLVLLAFIGLSSVCFAQTDTTFHFPNKVLYKSGTIYKLDGTPIHMQPLSFDINRNLVESHLPHQKISYHLLDVDKIEVEKGNEAWFWGIAFGVLATSISHRIVQNGGSEATYLFSLVGVGIGLGLGSGNKTYKTIYDNGYFIH